MYFKNVGVIGAGNIGLGVATDLVLHGINTVLVDISSKQLERAKSEIIKNVRFAPLFLKMLPRLRKKKLYNVQLSQQILTMLNLVSS